MTLLTTPLKPDDRPNQKTPNQSTGIRKDSGFSSGAENQTAAIEPVSLGASEVSINSSLNSVPLCSNVPTPAAGCQDGNDGNSTFGDSAEEESQNLSSLNRNDLSVKKESDDEDEYVSGGISICIWKPVIPRPE